MQLKVLSSYILFSDTTKRMRHDGDVTHGNLTASMVHRKPYFSQGVSISDPQFVEPCNQGQTHIAWTQHGMTSVSRDGHETEKRPSPPETRPRRLPHQPRQDWDETLVRRDCLKTETTSLVSRASSEIVEWRASYWKKWGKFWANRQWEKQNMHWYSTRTCLRKSSEYGVRAESASAM